MINLSIHVKFLGVRRSKLKVGRMHTATAAPHILKGPIHKEIPGIVEAAEVGEFATRSLPKQNMDSLDIMAFHDVPFIRITKLVVDSNNKNPPTAQKRYAGIFFSIAQAKNSHVHRWFRANLESPNATTFLGGASERNKWGYGFVRPQNLKRGRSKSFIFQGSNITTLRLKK